MKVSELMEILAQCPDPDRTVVIGIKQEEFLASIDEVYLESEGVGPNGHEIIVALVTVEKRGDTHDN